MPQLFRPINRFVIDAQSVLFALFYFWHYIFFLKKIMAYTIGTKKPLNLKTPPLSSEYTMHVDHKEGTDILVCIVGKTILHYNMSILNDLHAKLKKHND
jgi:hypothetical protein